MSHLSLSGDLSAEMSRTFLYTWVINLTTDIRYLRV